ncbi:MAG: hydroxyacid dehydrogenase [Candidatus Eisenbacteria bacterium]|uniref:Hydroxyacid dehydrogenase n=1 Tax=Eiseniibacteriota bacterium TaxID=2212470 RepID=A0A849SA82_UNCEI|nr:hydroxyacid dehydrogenase [Candidatus Eisenbacteria bacterium]
MVSDPLDAAALARLSASGHEVVERHGLQGAELAQALDGAVALLVRGGTRVTAQVLGGAPSLRVVVRAGTGLDNVDAEAAQLHGIRVLNTPGANRVAVAELVFGLLIAYERHLADAIASARAGHWEKARFAGREIAGRRLGLLGFGRIGREVAVRARAFDLSVAAYDPLLESWPQGFEWVHRLPLDELLASSDVVSLHLPLAPGTRGAIGARELGLMKKDAVLVNASRGGIVDEEALYDTLVNGRLRGALLDVFAVEPPGEHALLTLPNVMATPHLGASTQESQRRAGDEAVEVLLEALGELAPRG